MIEYLIDAMTYHRGKAEDRITDTGGQLLKHILKLYLFPNCQYTRGWEKEVRALYLDISRVATSLKKGKTFKAQAVTGFLYSDYYTRPSKLQDLVESIIELNEELVPQAFDINELYSLLLKVYKIIGECAVSEVPWSEFVVKLKAALV